MKTKTQITEFITSTSHQKVLKYLCENFDRDHYDSEIAREIKALSKASVNNSLKDLHAIGLINRRYLGNMALNGINIGSPLLKQFKILVNIANIDNLISQIGEDCEKIIMFGNSSAGTNHKDDTIDLFIVTEKVRSVEKKIENHPLFSKLRLIIHNSVQQDMFLKEAPAFYENIQKGISLK